MGDDVLGAARLETVDADLRHAGARALVEADREIELFRRVPERLVDRGRGSAGCCTGSGRRKPTRKPSSLRANLISSIASSIDCSGSIATPNRRSGYGLQ